MNKFYITTSIFYANGRPHIGHVLEMVQADVLARYNRLKKDDTFFLTGMDEHGSKIVRSAEEAGKEPQEWVDENAQVFKDTMERLLISYDNFIRTSDQKNHWPTAQQIWQRIEKSGDIYKKEYKGLYCVGHEAFVTEKDLDEDGECPDHGTEPEVVEEENYFFKLSKYADTLKEKYEDGEIRVVPQSRQNEILSFIDEGLEDISFSRMREQLKNWGVPVPGDEEQLMYVWCDALTNYLSGISYFSGSEATDFWPADVHLIGKDILRFHAAIWPAMLLSADIPLPKTILVHGFVSSGGKKMSKTTGNIVDPYEYLDEFGAEALRYFVIAEIPTTDDGDFTRTRFVERYNADLADGIGNLTARILALADGEDFSDIEVGPGDIDEAERYKKAWDDYGTAFSEYNLRKAASVAWDLIHWLDGRIEKTKPWEIDDKEKKKEALYPLLVGLSNVAWLVKPILPEAAKKIEEGLGIVGKETWDFKPQKIDPLFLKIDA